MEAITVTSRKGQFFFGGPEEAHYSAGSTAALCKLLLSKELATPDTPVHCVTDTGTVIWKEDYPIRHFLHPLNETKKDKSMTKTKTNPEAEAADSTPVANPGEPVVLKTKQVWIIADSMPGATRSEVVAECVKQGLNKSTASVQYGAWLKAHG